MVKRTLNVKIWDLIANSTWPPTNNVAWASYLTQKFYFYSDDEIEHSDLYLPVLLGTPDMIKFEGHKCKGHTINAWWTHILNVDNWDYHNPSRGVSMFYSYQYTCDLVNWKLSPVASFSILLRMTIHYNYSIMSLKWVLFSSLHTSGKAFQLTVNCMTSTSCIL